VAEPPRDDCGDDWDDDDSCVDAAWLGEAGELDEDCVEDELEDGVDDGVDVRLDDRADDRVPVDCLVDWPVDCPVAPAPVESNEL
jgi:hypothetical protein